MFRSGSVVLLSLILAACGAERDGSDTTGTTTTKPKTDGGTTTTTADAGTEVDAGTNTTPLVCTGADPTVGSWKTLSTITPDEQKQLCDFAACAFGGYGKSISCPGGNGVTLSVNSKDDLADCRADASWTKCGSLKVSEYVACQKKMNVVPCNALGVLFTDPACAPVKACTFPPS